VAFFVNLKKNVTFLHHKPWKSIEHKPNTKNMILCVITFSAFGILKLSFFIEKSWIWSVFRRKLLPINNYGQQKSEPSIKNLCFEWKIALQIGKFGFYGESYIKNIWIKISRSSLWIFLKKTRALLAHQIFFKKKSSFGWDSWTYSAPLGWFRVECPCSDFFYKYAIFQCVSLNSEIRTLTLMYQKIDSRFELHGKFPAKIVVKSLFAII
jgi:hypothetical protein